MQNFGLSQSVFSVVCASAVDAGFGASAEFGRASKLQAVTAFQWA